MSTFEEIVRDNFENSFLTGTKVKTVFGVTSCGQKYACFVSSVVWYAVRLIMEDEYLHLQNIGSQFSFGGRRSHFSWVELRKTWHLTLTDADAKIAEYQELLADIDNNCARFYSKYMGGKELWRIFLPLPKDWARHVDEYLERGDIIQCNLFLVHHVGIYLGNGKVAHLSGHGDRKATAKARVGELIPHFVLDTKSTLEVVALWVRARTKEQIAQTAERFADVSFREGQYNFFFRNCQHFVTLCALGYECLLEKIY